MADFSVDTRVEGSGGHYRATLPPAWDVWGPNGGFLAGLMLRALAAESAQPRPASFAAQYVSAGKFAPVEIQVASLRRGRRAEALRADLVQDGRILVTANAWFVAEVELGYVHDVTSMPAVPGYADLQGYQDRADNYDEWYPFWRSVEGRPCVWGETGPPVYHAWMRLSDTKTIDDPVIDAARQLLWLDTMMWNALIAPYDWPHEVVAPTLDLTAQFHRFAPGTEWQLCDAEGDFAGDGLGACRGRVWGADGRLLSTGTSHLLQRRNPTHDEELKIRQEQEAKAAGSQDARGESGQS